MAQRTTVQDFIDDLDGSEAEATVTFALDGIGYEIDLSTKNAEKLKSALQKYVDAARRTSGRRGGSRGRSGRRSSNSADVRAWAVSQGIKMSGRGRIPGSVQQQYDAAH